MKCGQARARARFRMPCISGSSSAHHRVYARVAQIFYRDAVNRYEEKNMCVLKLTLPLCKWWAPTERFSASITENGRNLSQTTYDTIPKNSSRQQNTHATEPGFIGTSLPVNTECTLLYSLHFISRCNSFCFHFESEDIKIDVRIASQYWRPLYAPIELKSISTFTRCSYVVFPLLFSSLRTHMCNDLAFRPPDKQVKSSHAL